jgi:thiol-disulfide isomerase/thioredoxin
MVIQKLSAALCLATLMTASAADLPRKCPDFALHLADGKNVSLSQFHGKVVALAFISTTCPHCQNYTRLLSAIQKEYAPKGVQVLAAAFNDGAQTLVPGFIAQFQPAFPVGWEDRVSALSFLQISVLNQGYVPKIVFIDRGGMITKQYEGQDDFFHDPDKSTRAALDEMLKAPAPVAHRKAAVKTATKQQ